MKSETQPASVVSLNHQETATPATEFLLPPRNCHNVKFFLKTRPELFFWIRAYCKMSEAEGEWVSVLHKSQETTINLKKLPQMPASVFLNHSGRNWQNPDCSFYLPVSMSRKTPVVKDAFLTEVVVRDVRNWVFQYPLLKLINRSPVL